MAPKQSSAERRSTDVAFSLLQNNFTHMEETVSRLEETMSTHYKTQEEQMAQLIEAMEKRYANKWVEKVLTFIMTTTGGILISALVYLVVHK